MRQCRGRDVMGYRVPILAMADPGDDKADGATVIDHECPEGQRHVNTAATTRTRPRLHLDWARQRAWLTYIRDESCI